MKKRRNKKSERGIALLVALFALILIAAVGLGMIFSSNSELGVNNSFRQNHLAYFAARSGLEEARDRMRYKSTEVTNPLGLGISDLLPTTTIGQAAGVLYIKNVAGIDPTNFGNNTYFDDELCHDINNPGVIVNSPGAFNIKCPHTANSIPSGAGWNVQLNSEPVPGGGTIPYAWTRINLKLQEGTNPWCVLGLGFCNPATGPDASADQVCYDGTREFVLTDAMPLRDAPGGIGGVSVPSQLAMGMYFGGTSGHGASGHSSTTGSSTSSSTTGSSTGSSSTGTSSTGTSGSGSTTGTSSTGSSTTGSSTTGSSTTGSSTTGSSTTGSSTTGSSTTGSTTTGSSTTGSSTTGSTATGSSTTGSSTTGSSTTGSSTTGSSTTGSTTTGSSSTGSTTGTSSTGTSSTGTSSTGTSSSGSGTSGGTGGGTGGACSGVFTPPAPPATFATSSCSNVNSQPVYTVTSLAITPGGARRMLQYEIARITVPPVPAAVTLAGPNPIVKPPNSANFGINGTDANSCAASGHQPNNVPAIGTTTDTGNPGTGETATQVASDSATSVANTLTGPGVKTSNFTGAGCTSAQGGDDVQNVINVSPSYNTIAGLNAVVQSVIGSADVVTSSASTVTNWGVPDASGNFTPVVVAITGNADVTAASGGNGLLLVTGNMVASGSFSWNGTILVIGSGSITFNGGGSGNINGAVVVANIGNSDYPTDPTNAGNLLSQLGPPTFAFNGGGINGITYDSCLTTKSTAHAAYKVLARREIVY